MEKNSYQPANVSGKKSYKCFSYEWVIHLTQAYLFPSFRKQLNQSQCSFNWWICIFSLSLYGQLSRLASSSCIINYHQQFIAIVVVVVVAALAQDDIIFLHSPTTISGPQTATSSPRLPRRSCWESIVYSFRTELRRPVNDRFHNGNIPTIHQ